MIVTVINPDAPFDSPAYDGEPADAHKYLIPGSYRCEYYSDAAETMNWGTLVVTDGESHLDVGARSKPAGDLKPGDRISFAIGDKPWNEFSGPRNITFSTGTIEHNDPLNSHGGRNLGIRDDSNTLHIRYWHESEMVDMAANAWTDANGNEYRTSTTAAEIADGADIALPPGTVYTLADVSEFDPSEVDAVGTVATATDIDENGCICGLVTAAKQDGELTLITILIEQSPPWTFSVPAATPVYVV